MANFSGAAQGFLNFDQQQQQRQMQQAQLAGMLQERQQRAMVLQRMQAAQQARPQAFDMLSQMGQQPQAQVPPPPGLMPPQPAAPPPGAMSPGGGNPQAQGGVPPPPAAGAPPPQAAAAGSPQPGPQMALPPPQPFRPMPTSPPAGAMPGQVPPPPAAQAQQHPEVVAPPHIDIRKAIENISKNVPPEQRMEVLDQMMPVIQAAQADELKFFRAQTQAQTAAIQAYRATIEQYKADIASRRADTGEARLDQQIARDEQRHQEATKRNDIAEKRMLAAISSAVGGQQNMKGVEYIYPKGEDGKPDQSKPPLGTRGTTKTGKIIYMDADGNPTTAQSMAGGTAKEGKGPGGAQAAVRANLVKSGVKNSLDRLAEIEKTFPDTNTSVFFGTHAENPLTKSVYGAGKGMQSTGQRQADAAWASFIDEAIPVFTGGLRGSDAFRRFLIEQAPGPGDDKGSRTEKIRLLKANINGTSKAFFQKFSSDPSMWATGTKPEDVQGGGGAAPAPAAGGWKVEKVQ